MAWPADVDGVCCGGGVAVVYSPVDVNSAKETVLAGVDYFAVACALYAPCTLPSALYSLYRLGTPEDDRHQYSSTLDVVVTGWKLDDEGVPRMVSNEVVPVGFESPSSTAVHVATVGELYLQKVGG